MKGLKETWGPGLLDPPPPLTVFVCRHFDVKPPSDVAAAAALFSVPDFVGDASKAIASRIRGAVASVQFDDFHKVRRSTRTFRVKPVQNRLPVPAELQPDHLLGRVRLRREAGGPVQPALPAEQPGDQQRGHPVRGARGPEDPGRAAEERPARHRDHHQLPGGGRQVRRSITVLLKGAEPDEVLFTCRHEAERLEQEAQGKLERQRITDQAQAEKARKELLELEALR